MDGGSENSSSSGDGEQPVSMEAFSLLAHEIRLDVLRAFFEQWTTLDPDSREETKAQRALSYSELMDAVGMEDSGKFNYHLDKLRGVYVEQIGEEYVPTASAVALYQAVVANRPTDAVGRTEFEIDMDCPYCSGTVTGRYEQEYLTIDCIDCDQWWGLTYPFPKNGLAGRSGNDLFEALERRTMYHIGLAREGQCPACAGHVGATIPRDRLDGEQYPTVELHCTTCSWVATIDVLNALRFAPRVLAALSDLGMIPDEEASTPVPEVTGTVNSEDPFRAAIEVRTEDGLATVLVDEELTVQSVELS